MDSWEDADEDNFQVNLPVPSKALLSAPDSWDEEEDETLLEQKKAALLLSQKALSLPSQQQLEQQRKKEQIEEEKLQNLLKFAKQENETNEERVIRERKQVEEADAVLAEELFDNSGNNKKSTSSSSGLAGLSLKNKDDHINFGILAANKMSNSTSFCITAFLKEILTRNGNILSAESLTDLSTQITKLQASKKQADDLNKKNAKSKKQQKAEAKKHAEIFGGDYDKPSEYETFANMEDDFM